jgi:CHAT domain-containing protein/tetratricopeptide (TPR) repeat protein
MKFNRIMKTGIAFTFILLVSGLNGFSQNTAQTESLRKSYLLLGKYDSALYYAEETAAIIRGTIGENNLQFADALDGLAVSNFFLGNYTKSIYYASIEVDLRETLKATHDQGFVRSLENLAIIDCKSGYYDDALQAILKTEKSAEKIFGPQSIEYANILSTYAGIFDEMGTSVNDVVFLKKANEFFEKANNIYLANGTLAQIQCLVNKSNQASYFNNLGNSPKAESLFQEVLLSCGILYGKSNLLYAAALNNLAVFYLNNGYYKQAENFFIEAIGTYKNLKLETGISAGICINNLGALYLNIGNYGAAEKLMQQAGEQFKNNCLGFSPLYAVVLNNQVAVNLSREYFASSNTKNRGKLLKCGQTLFFADSLLVSNCRMPQPAGFIIKNNLAVWYKMTGDSKKSYQIVYDEMFKSNVSMNPISMVNKMGISSRVPTSEIDDAHSALEPILVPLKANAANIMVDEQSLKQNEMDQTASTRFLIKMIIGKADKVKKTLGPYHPVYASVIAGFIPLYKSIGSYDMEEDLTLEYMNIINHNTLQDFTFLSESEKEMYFQTKLPDMHAFFAYALKRKEKNPAITTYAYNLIIQNKGLMLKSSTAMRQAILSSNDPVLLGNYDKWLSLQKEISALYSTPVEMRTKDLKDLESQANALEKDLVKNSQTFGDYRKGMQTTWKDVRDNLKPDEAAIEFTNFRVKEKDLGNVVYYCALVVRPNSLYPEMIKLFEEKQLADIIGTEQDNNYSYINNLYGTKNESRDMLYKLIWQPLEAYLGGVNKIYLSPAGLLYKISFASLSSGRDVFLCDKYRIQVKGSTGNIENQETMPSDNNLSALVFGGIKYSETDKGSAVWNYLSGTKQEGDAVTDILKNEKVSVLYLTGASATETYLKQNAQKYNILHVATHGFFFPDPNEIRFAQNDEHPVEYGAVTFRGASRGFGVNSFVNNVNPLMRSGLVFAGANDVWDKPEPDKQDDGVLTAQEVTQIDMRKNILVVLSACETGLGDIKGSEGVYGLQRSFKMAGVKYVMVSLWQVPDKETVEFMETFYTKLLNERDVKKAFAETQKEMRQKYDPYYWSAFSLIE